MIESRGTPISVKTLTIPTMDRKREPAKKILAKGKAIKKLIIEMIQAMENPIISANPTMKNIGFQTFPSTERTREIAKPSNEIPFLRAFLTLLPRLDLDPVSPVLFFLMKNRIRYRSFPFSQKRNQFPLR